MKTILQKSFLTNLIFTLVMSLSLVSCLPVKKETQCSENEAFNASKRKCVPVIGASTGNTVFIGAKSPANSYSTSVQTVAPITHTVSVSDVYNYGFTVNWYLHTSTVTATSPTAVNTTAFSFSPSIYPAGNYIVEAILLDESGTNQLDSVSWNIFNGSLTSPSLVSPSPAATGFTYLKTDTATRTLQATINSPDSKAGNYYIYFDGVLEETAAFTGTATIADYTIIPSTLSSGLHTVEIKIFDGTNTDPLFDSYSWLINIIDPDYPVINPTSANTNPIITETITIRDATLFSAAGWALDDGSNLDLGTTGLCIEFDNVDKLSPVGPDIEVEYTVGGNIISTGTRVGASNVYCADEAQLDAASNYFNLSFPDVAEARTITVQTFAIGTRDLIEALSWNVVIRPQNIRPIISIDGAKNSGAGCSQVTAINYDSCILEQSVNIDIDSNDTIYESGTVGNFAIQFFDPDIQSEDDYFVFFQLKKAGDSSWNNVNMNASASDNPYSYSDCTYSDTDTSGTVPSSDKLVCALRIDAFNNLGKLESGDYELQAFIRDTGDGAGTGTTKDSNLVTWKISVTENQDVNSIEIANFVNDGSNTSATRQNYFINGVNQGSTTFTQSWIAADNSSTVSLATISEGTQYVINTLVRDSQRDDFSISVTMDNQFLGGISTLASTTIIDENLRLDNREWHRAQTTVIIPEWAVTSDQASNIYVSVSDRPESYLTDPASVATATKTLTINVTNVNPAPTFTAEAADVDLTGYFAVAGVPFTIPASSLDDDSLYDGANITWEWRIDVGQTGTFTKIPNADSIDQVASNLIWTPNSTIPNNSLIDLRLCVGDDGDGNEVANCGVNKTWTDLTVLGSSSYVARTEVPADTSSSNELATWFDPEKQALYTAYTAGTNIFVEKAIMDPANNNEFKTIHSISFPSEDTEAGIIPVIAQELSISGISDDGGGTNGQLVIAYKVVENLSGFPRYRVRRIDIRNDRLNFNYCGMFHNLINNGSHTTCETDDLYDEVNSTLLTADPDITGISSGNGILDITFSDTPDGNHNFIIRTNAGDSITYRFGALTDPVLNIQGFCPGGGCDATSTAIDFAAAINNTQATPTVDTEIEAASHEFYAEVTVAGTVRIHGPAEFDYYDETSTSSSYIGNIQAVGDDWLLPFIDISNSQKISIAKGDSVTDQLGLIVTPISSTTLISTSGINNQEVKQFFKGTTLYIAAKNANTDLDVFKVRAADLLLLDSVKDVYSTASVPFQLEGIDITVNDAETDIFISAVNRVGGRDLTIARLDATDIDDITTNIVVEKVLALGYEQYIEDIRHARIISDSTTAGDNYITLSKTGTAAVNADSAYMIKINYNNGIFDFHEYDYPKLNINDLVSDAAISATPVYTFTGIAHSGAPLTTAPAGMQDAISHSLFFNFHESDTENKIRAGFYNTDETNIMTESSALTGSAPGFIGN